MISNSVCWVLKHFCIWNMPCQNMSSGICGQGRPRSACVDVQSDQSLYCLLTESLDIIECINGELMPGLDFAYA